MDCGAERTVQALRERLGAELLQTHVSWVLLHGSQALKIKKPVRLSFLDASELGVRRHLCEEELRLNRRLAPSIYVDVVPITGSAERPQVGGDGEAIEYAVRMSRFAPDALFSQRVASGRLRGTDIDALATRLAHFHRDAAVAPADSSFGEPRTIAQATHGVLQQLQALLPEPLPAAVQRWAAGRRERMSTTWQRRKAAGAIREGHGDLHLDNLVLLNGQATAFDCVEFDPALRWIDVMDDLAFAVMDLAASGRLDLAWRLLNAYLDESGEHEGLAVVRDYMIHRALVRALVHLLRAGAAMESPMAARYLALAAHLAGPTDARLLITCGVSGSGKSWLAHALLQGAHAVRLRSDVERKRLYGLHAAQSSAQVPGGIYGDAATRRTYARLLELADIALGAEQRVIVDAAFLKAGERAAFAGLAARHGVPFTIAHCTAPRRHLAARIQERAQRGDDPSEADANVLSVQLQSFQPLTQQERACAIALHMERPVAPLSVARGWLAARATAPASAPAVPRGSMHVAQ